MSAPLFTVVVPVFNGGQAFGLCLEALASSEFRDYELVVVDDGSTDGSADVAERHGALVLATGGRTGPASARNLGARQARGDYLFFVDADCEVEPSTLSRAATVVSGEPELVALFGSYDDEPAGRGLLTQYKNLQHHWVHQNGREEASTFWAGCGVVRRSVFLELGGFDAQRYAKPSIEDIELGYRLRAAGHRIRLDRGIQVKHHKIWRLGGLLRTDVFDRAVPWTRLMLERGRLDNDLNVGAAGRLSAAMVWLLLLSAIGGVFEPRLWWLTAVAALVLVAANRRFYRFLLSKRGLLFTLRAVPFHWLYYLYSVAAFGLGLVAHITRIGSGSQ